MGILVKEELCEKVVEVRRCDRVTAIGLVLEEEVVRVICAHAPQSGKPDAEKERFYEKLAREWSVANENELVLGLGLSLLLFLLALIKKTQRKIPILVSTILKPAGSVE